MRVPLYRLVARAALCLALLVAPLGAFVRLSDAGLGCPDWPGCYGRLVGVPGQEGAAQAFPDRPLEAGKAWKEVIHRYAAGTLATLVAAVTVLAWRRRRRLAPAVLGVVVFQALLGMWTVTLLLRPVIVTGHLLGGMTLIALLTLLAFAHGDASVWAARSRGPRRLAAFTLAALTVQIALGGWVSTNYAALACQDFPGCQGSLWPRMAFGPAFTLVRELGRDAQGDLLPLAALTAIHWAHRCGALLMLLLGGSLAVRLLADPHWRGWGLGVAVALLAQLAMGVANVLLSLPLPLAVAHNLGAALLLATLVLLNARLAGH